MRSLPIPRIRPIARVAFALAVVGGLLISLPALPRPLGAVVAAHSQLVSSIPGAGEAVDTPPPELRLQFSESIASGYTSFDLLDGTGKTLLLTAGHVDATDDHLLVGALPALPPDTYTVDWRALSAADGHVTEGAFTFAVTSGPVPSGGAAPIGPPAQGTDTIHVGHDATQAAVEIQGKVLAYGGVMLAFGLPLVAWFAIRPAMGGRLPRIFALGGGIAHIAVAVGTGLLIVVSVASLPSAGGSGRPARRRRVPDDHPAGPAAAGPVRPGPRRRRRRRRPGSDRPSRGRVRRRVGWRGGGDRPGGGLRPCGRLRHARPHRRRRRPRRVRRHLAQRAPEPGHPERLRRAVRSAVDPGDPAALLGAGDREHRPGQRDRHLRRLDPDPRARLDRHALRDQSRRQGPPRHRRPRRGRAQLPRRRGGPALARRPVEARAPRARPRRRRRHRHREPHERLAVLGEPPIAIAPAPSTTAEAAIDFAVQPGRPGPNRFIAAAGGKPAPTGTTVTLLLQRLDSGDPPARIALRPRPTRAGRSRTPRTAACCSPTAAGTRPSRSRTPRAPRWAGATSRSRSTPTG